jgi:hypothetical protein
MFVKAGIVAAVAAASLVAVSPLAFAGDYGSDSKGHHKSSKDDDDDNDRGDHKSWKKHRDDDGDCNGDVNQVNNGDSRGLINVSGVNAAVPVNVCDNDIISGVLGVLSKDLTNNDNH